MKKIFLTLFIIPALLQAARIRTTGYEMAYTKANSKFEMRVDQTFSGTMFIDSTNFHSGTRSLRFDINSASQPNTAWSFPSVSRPYHWRIWFRYDAAPNGASRVFIAYNGTDQVGLRLQTNGKLSLETQNVDRVTTAAALPTNTWLLIKIASNWQSTGNSPYDSLQVNGETLVTNTAFTTTGPTVMNIGWTDNTITGSTFFKIWFDDIAFNDGSGSAETGAPDDSGHVVYLRPVSDNAIGGWTAGAGSTSNLWDAVNQLPPRGIVGDDNATSIKNVVSSATDNYDANIQSYTAAGIPATAKIRLVQAVVRAGEHSATGTESGAVQLVSNPSDGGETTFSFGDDAGAHGNDTTQSITAASTLNPDLNWRTEMGSYVYLPTVVRGTQPVVRVGKRTASTNQVCVDFIGILVEYGANGSEPAATGRVRIIN